MKRTLIALTVLLIPLSTGCVSKQKFEDAQVELATCQEEKVQAEAQVIAWEQRFDRESSRWEGMETSISDALPKALSEFSDERDRILELVPDQVQSEVATYLDDYFATVMTGFERLVEDNQEIKLQLDATQATLDSLEDDTMSISASIDGALAEERSKRDDERAKRENVSIELATIVAQLVDFDQTRINCKACPQRLKLSRKEREAITAFHTELTSSLAELQGYMGQ
ncbi:MAG: hypothetical protein GY856_45875 [bacterium]|nr:hypothetical protein [bacterium]